MPRLNPKPKVKAKPTENPEQGYFADDEHDEPSEEQPAVITNLHAVTKFDQPSPNASMPMPPATPALVNMSSPLPTTFMSSLYSSTTNGMFNVSTASPSPIINNTTPAASTSSIKRKGCRVS